MNIESEASSTEIPSPNEHCPPEVRQILVEQSGAPEPDRPLPRWLGANYLLLSRIGKGGMGVVYLAWEFPLARFVAVKEVLPERGKQVRASALLEEARRQSNLGRHENIAMVYGADIINGEPYIAMEFVAGPMLSQRIAAQPSLSRDEALQLAIQIAGGLSDVHEFRSFHGDLKPGNIRLQPPRRVPDISAWADQLPSGRVCAITRAVLEREAQTSGDELEAFRRHLTSCEACLELVRDVLGRWRALVYAGIDERRSLGVAKLLDFGLSGNARDDGVPLGPQVHRGGTPGYRAREQCAGIADRRSDIFSFGVIFRELLIPPERGERRAGVTSEKVRGFEDKLPRRLRAILQRCLEPNPERRYQDGTELWRALMAYQTFRRVSQSALVVVLTAWLLASLYVYHRWSLQMSVVSETVASAVNQIDRAVDLADAKRRAQDLDPDPGGLKYVFVWDGARTNLVHPREPCLVGRALPVTHPAYGTISRLLDCAEQQCSHVFYSWRTYKETRPQERCTELGAEARAPAFACTAADAFWAYLTQAEPRCALKIGYARNSQRYGFTVGSGWYLERSTFFYMLALFALPPLMAWAVVSHTVRRRPVRC